MEEKEKVVFAELSALFESWLQKQCKIVHKMTITTTN